MYREYTCNTPLIAHKGSNKIRLRDDLNFKGLRVLLVDDEYFSRAALIRILQRGELDVSAYTNGNEVLKKLKTAEYDLAIFDYQMPKMDGMTLTTKVRELEVLNNKKPMAIICSL